MWIGHVAPAFLLRPFLPQVPLAVLFFGCASADVVGFIFSLLGIEQFRYNPIKSGALPYDFLMPYSHSLLGMTVWAVLLAAVATVLVQLGVIRSGDTASKPSSSGTAASPAPISWTSIFFPTVLVTISHWVLEIPVHRTLRDGVPLVPQGSTKFGWGWFEYQLLTNAIELGLFLPSVFFYLSKTHQVSRTVPWYARPATLITFCVISQLMVCASPQWFYKYTPETVIMLNGLTLMASESAVAHLVDSRRVTGTGKIKN